jgi:hypothetical protein
MACNDRQLSQAQREAGYQQQRTGVVRALRPFGGSPTLENLLDYINRELVPAVRAGRDAVNDVYLQVADNAPSANPLAYYFSTSTANADPTTGRVRLNASPQNTATVIRLSQSNARLVDVTPWLDVMSGGPTTPLGTVTLVDAINPSRFLRWDLNTMTDQGAYWDLGVTFIEGSHDDPFVDDEAVTLGFIAGVSAAGSTVPVGSLSPIARDTFIGNITTATAAPVAVPLADVDSTSLVYDATSHTFQRAALTGFATATQNSNATSSAEPIVTYSASPNMSAERVTTSSTSITVDIATAGQIEFRSAAKTGAISQAANANATLFAGILDNGAAENDRTSLDFITTNDVALAITDNSGSDKLEIRATLAAGTTQNEGTGGVVTVNAGTKVLAITANITITGFARSGGNVDGDRFWVRCNDGIECTLDSSAAGTGVNAISCPYNEDMIVPGRGMVEFRYETSWRTVSTGNKGRLVRYTEYASGSGTHTYLSETQYAIRDLTGGGGAGGGVSSGGSGSAAAGGGQAGSTIRTAGAVTPGDACAYSVGAGGTGVSGGNGNDGDGTTMDGATGARGGNGGPVAARAATNSANPGGGDNVTADQGDPGGAGISIVEGGVDVSIGGRGGNGPEGGGGWVNPLVGTGTRTGSAGRLPGAGGSGAANNATASDVTGGSGRVGRIRIWEYT